MAIPISYNFRNLKVRKTTTIMTALGVALTVAVLVAVMALVDGLRTALTSSGSPLNVLVMRKGSSSELSGGLTRSAFQDVKANANIARNAAGEPLASLELVSVINLANETNPGGMNITLRGLLPIGFEMREKLRITDGRWFEQGKREVVVGAAIAKRYPDARLGGTLSFGKGEWHVVGVMDAGQGPINSEIWGDLNQMAGDYNRLEALSAALLRARDPGAVTALIRSIEDDPRLNAGARTEKDYLEAQTISGAPIQYMGIFISIIMAVGSAFAAMNTMYAAVARRSREIGTLRILGFPRSSILLSFFIESLLLAGLGGILGCLIVLPLNGITTGIGSFVTFSEIAFNFRVDARTCMIGLAFALIMGALGGLFPARMAARKEILTALREI